MFSLPRTFWKLPYHGYSLWLFTFSDLKTIVFPSTAFGIVNAATAESYGIKPLDRSKMPTAFLLQSCLSLLWVWLNLLPFAINNQRDILAITEDRINKPWRPFPSHRIGQKSAWYLMLFLYFLAVLHSYVIGTGLRQSLSLVVLGAFYNNFGGADRSPLVRNLINAAGYLSFISGAMEVALNRQLSLELGARLTQWLLMLAGVIVSTVHTQDMADQEGDAMRGRRTVPLALGDGFARWSIAVAMTVWGLVCPAFWRADSVAFGLSVFLSAVVGLRTLLLRNVTQDKVTFRIWNLWVVLLYLLPLSSAN